MLPDRVSNPGPVTYESGALPIALRGPAVTWGGNFFGYMVANFVLRSCDRKTKFATIKPTIYLPK